MKHSRKSQISFEYMMVVGMMAIIIIPLVLIYYSYSSSSSSSTSTSQALLIARKIVDSSESVYYLGKPSFTTLTINFPENIDSINLSSKEVTFKIKTKDGVSDIVAISTINITGNLPKSAGVHVLTVRAENGYVSVTSN